MIIALAGVLIAVAAYLKKRTCALCDDYEQDIMDDDMDMEFYAQDDIGLMDEDPDLGEEPETAAEE
ncbi:hypothetical protein [Zongyangia hominis]|uniref:Uncharacterized protein n=1 Tax=Zongyangia hominis TaxID=2763677 RepID=A0A926ECP2_9FIRM|nr:hypothetical protein [Zongyangia hominis]MBC8571393.1 hypothetical protein [Zongyangia hominis]